MVLRTGVTCYRYKHRLCHVTKRTAGTIGFRTYFRLRPQQRNVDVFFCLKTIFSCYHSCSRRCFLNDFSSERCRLRLGITDGLFKAYARYYYYYYYSYYHYYYCPCCASYVQNKPLSRVICPTNTVFGEANPRAGLPGRKFRLFN